jgi:hypothetical protein
MGNKQGKEQGVKNEGLPCVGWVRRVKERVSMLVSNTKRKRKKQKFRTEGEEFKSDRG